MKDARMDFCYLLTHSARRARPCERARFEGAPAERPARLEANLKLYSPRLPLCLPWIMAGLCLRARSRERPRASPMGRTSRRRCTWNAHFEVVHDATAALPPASGAPDALTMAERIGRQVKCGVCTWR